MKKKGRTKIEGNLILFPDLEKRLLHKGLEEIQERNFSTAIKLLEEAKALGTDDGEVYIALVLAYYESGALHDAQKLAKEMLNEGIGDYFETIDLYLMILVQLHEYEEIITTIEALQEEREIPFEREEHFIRLLTLSKRMIEQGTVIDEKERPDLHEEEAKTLFEQEGDPNKQLIAMAELAQKNIRPHLKQVEAFLMGEKGHPFMKTMLLHAMLEQEIDKEVTVKKFDWEQNVIPAQLLPPQENEQLQLIQKNLQHIEQNDPVLFQHIMSLLERHLFLIYPFSLPSFDDKVWAAAYHQIGLEFHGTDPSEEEIAEVYGVRKHSIDKACSFIRDLEKISYPII